MTIAVAVAIDRWKDDADMFSTSLSKNLGVNPPRGESQVFAGPNDVVQWIATFADWKEISFGLAMWLLGKVGDDVYDAIKAKLVSAFGEEQKSVNVRELPEEASTIVRKTQSAGGDFVLTAQEEPISEGSYVPRATMTVHVPPLSDDGGVFLAKYIINFSLSIEKMREFNGQIPNDLRQIVTKPGGDVICVLNPIDEQEKDNKSDGD